MWTELVTLPILRRMCPDTALLDIRNGLLGDVVALSNNLLLRTAFEQTSDFAYVCPRQTGKAVVLTPIALVIAHTIRADILGTGAPLQVLQRSVKLAAGAVQRFLPVRARADERFEHKVVQETLPARTAGRCELDFPVSVVPDGSPNNLAAANTPSRLPWKRTEPAEITDFVEPFPRGNGLPNFVHASSLHRGTY